MYHVHEKFREFGGPLSEIRLFEVNLRADFRGIGTKENVKATRESATLFLGSEDELKPKIVGQHQLRKGRSIVDILLQLSQAPSEPMNNINVSFGAIAGLSFSADNSGWMGYLTCTLRVIYRSVCTWNKFQKLCPIIFVCVPNILFMLY